MSVSVRTKTAVRVQKHSFIDKPTSPSPGRISKDWYKFLYNHSQHNYNTTPPFITALHSPSLESTPDHTGHGHTERERDTRYNCRVRGHCLCPHSWHMDRRMRRGSGRLGHTILAIHRIGLHNIGNQLGWAQGKVAGMVSRGIISCGGWE